MKRIYHCLFLILVCLSQAGPAIGQNKKNTVSVVDFLLPTVAEITEKRNQYGKDNPYFTYNRSPEAVHEILEKLPAIVADYFGKDDRFILVDRASTVLVERERELQKSESFLDGYVVAQGKSIGAEYLVSGEFDIVTYALNLTLYSVAEQQIVGTETADLFKALFKPVGNPIREPVLNATRRLSDRQFPLLMPVVEITEQKKDEAKAVLIAAGMGRGLRNGTKLDVKIKETRTLDGIGEQTYYRTIGNATVDKVEDQNFSIIRIDDGKKEVKARLDAGTQLYCTFQL